MFETKDYLRTVKEDDFHGIKQALYSRVAVQRLSDENIREAIYALEDYGEIKSRLIIDTAGNRVYLYSLT